MPPAADLYGGVSAYRTGSGDGMRDRNYNNNNNNNNSDNSDNNNNNNNNNDLPPFFPLQNQNQVQPQQRPKSSYLRQLMSHKRSNTVGAGQVQLPPAVFSTDFQKSSDSDHHHVMSSSAASVIDPDSPELLRPPNKINPDLVAQRHSCDMNLTGYQRHQFAAALCELRPNQLDDQPPRSPEKKSNPFTTISLKSPFGLRDSSKASKNKGDQSPTKPKKVKSAANIGQLLRPKSDKNLRQQEQEEEENSRRRNKDKENRAPSAIDTSPPPPIYAQFARGSPFALPPELNSSTKPVPSPLDYRNPFWDSGKPLPADPDRPGTGGTRSSIAESQHLKSEAENRERDRNNSRSKSRPKTFHQYFASNSQQDEKRTPSDSSTDTRYKQPQSDNQNQSSPQEKQERSWKRQTWATAKTSDLAAGGSSGSDRSSQRLNVKSMFSSSGNGGGSSSSAGGERSKSGATAAAAAAATQSTSMERQQSAPPLLQQHIDPKDIDKHLEAMLDRRNIPENQRYKMRNLNDTIKLEFIRQDWAEMQAKMVNQNASNTSLEKGGNAGSVNGGAGSEREDQQQQQQSSSSSRREDGNSKDKDNERTGRTKKKGFGLSLGKGAASKAQSSPTKSIGRHFRSKSNDSSMNERPSFGDVNGNSGGNGVGGFLGMKGGKSQQVPADFVAYLQKVHKPELVEVGKLHKLRLLLRNETVAWTEEFIKQGGMKEIVDLLHRIMAVEWREEHEDALLHENLLCLKALCTTALALQYLHTIHATLFPALLHLIFDPEKKGPSEFTTRNIITSILLTYIECATPQERITRAQTILQFLRDPETEEEKKPVNFILEMRRERPYRVWCKEAVSVTKEVFWIFLHNMNIVSLPPADSSLSGSSGAGGGSSGINGEQKDTQQQQLYQAGIIDPSALTRNDTESGGEDSETATPAQLAYMSRHFPQERPPVPAAPYVGGVEWDATNYLASHLDLMNAIIACTGPTATERNALRAQLRISGWERCLGGSLRMCKEKFYGSVHDGLRTWVAAAAEDGWDVRDVRFGPPPEGRGYSPMKKTPGKKPREEAPPKIEIPKLDFHIGGADSPGIGVSPGGLGVGMVAASVANINGNGGGGGRSPMPVSPAVRAPDYWLS
ncbi:hypothetical protein NEUTE1DRAFT_132128 [Neurospora tetrasperma FGSC 2508]|uniref:Formin GTPase-binding domain-containing protein n=1 Tax=Neurospora tetrasperma (strain FGSC 2508 / ATCC MYA-4615 / P0657) TaxID=510951 RepID=F8MV55_NEUT8|nr:uncharacterized protein NEUTE1DRAFT_132128 [Neurospora tetrasperma FGSC 2508]EGO54680.1 hypothetical protein NEUTE1DRAFT_132128 [Neurospora tetrasperma FGSC 2508]EGZ67846.1 hypothetical protein NEUTE2DRAFT_117146 [Neurospora tetrasperma FGSC 2509]